MRIAVFGAGSIGCLIGGSLIAIDQDVVLIGRKQIGDEIKANGLTVSDLEGKTITIPADKVSYSLDPASLKGADIILVTVKCTDTQEAADQIAKHADKNSVVYSLQNGVGNTPILGSTLKGFDVVAGMVAFNALWMENAHFHRATDAGIVLGRHVDSHRLARLLKQANIPTTIGAKIQSVLWGKLCLNLNNAINVLSDMPLKKQLENRNYRKVLAICVEEALAVMKAKNIEPEKVGKVSPKHIPTILNLPDAVFKLVARSMMKIDEKARSSMWEDLQKGREPEIDYLNGAIVREGIERHVDVRANEAITNLVKEAFAKGCSPQLSGEQLLEAVGSKD